jgi:hypothetical protein
MIQMLGRIRNAQVAVKVHTRSGTFRRVSAPNIAFCEDVASSALIDWADLTLFSGTSVVVDALQRNKPVLHIRRACANKSMFDRYIESWHIDCRDDLAKTVFRLQSGEQKRTYSEEEREKLMKALVEPKGKDVLGLYIAEILSTVEKISGRAA